MVVQCDQCGHTGPAVEHPKSALSGLFSSDKIEYTCAKCGGAALRKVQYCTRCGHVGVPHIENVKEFSMGLFVVLFVFGIIPGLIYILIGGTTQPYYECTQCRGRLVIIPVDSPVAQASLSKKPQVQSLNTGNAVGNRANNFCSSCGTALSSGSRFCNRCGQAV